MFTLTEHAETAERHVSRLVWASAELWARCDNSVQETRRGVTTFSETCDDCVRTLKSSVAHAKKAMEQDVEPLTTTANQLLALADTLENEGAVWALAAFPDFTSHITRLLDWTGTALCIPCTHIACLTPYNAWRVSEGLEDVVYLRDRVYVSRMPATVEDEDRVVSALVRDLTGAPVAFEKEDVDIVCRGGWTTGLRAHGHKSELNIRFVPENAESTPVSVSLRVFGQLAAGAPWHVHGPLRVSRVLGGLPPSIVADFHTQLASAVLLPTRTVGPLMYRGSRHGMRMEILDARCSSAGPTLTLIRLDDAWGRAFVMVAFTNAPLVSKLTGAREPKSLIVFPGDSACDWVIHMTQDAPAQLCSAVPPPDKTVRMMEFNARFYTDVSIPGVGWATWAETGDKVESEDVVDVEVFCVH